MKILAAIPSLDMVHVDFALSLCGVLNRVAYDRALSRSVQIALANVKGSLIMDARNRLVQTAQDISATHIWFIDSDVTFPPDALDRLIAHHKPVVAASYVKRYPPHDLLGNIATVPTPPSVLAPMLTIPLGMALIKLSVFADHPPPHFAYIQGADAASTQSEDTFFCNWARLAGHTIHLDTELTKSIGHIGMKTYRPGDAS